MRKYLNGEVFLVLFLLSGFYKASLSEIIPIDATLLFFGLSVLSALGRLYKNRNLHRSMMKPAFVYTFISTLMLISLFFADGNSYAFSKTMSFIVITGWSFFGVFLLVDKTNPKQSIQRFIGSFLFVGILMVFGTFFTEQQSLKFTSSFGSNYLALGKMAAIVGIILFSYLLLLANKRKAKVVAVSVFLVSVYTLLTSGGRMPVISFVICILLLLSLGIKFNGFEFKDIKIKKKTLVFSFSGLLFVPILINFMENNGNVFLSRLLSLFDDGNSRSEHYNHAWNAFTESNLLGVGSGGYLPFTNSFGERAYPHNIILEFMAELGLIGLISFMLLLAIALVRYFKYFYNRHNFYSITILLLFIYSLLNAFTSGDFNDNRMLFFFIALLSMSQLLGKVLNREAKNLDSEQSSH